MMHPCIWIWPDRCGDMGRAMGMIIPHLPLLGMVMTLSGPDIRKPPDAKSQQGSCRHVSQRWRTQVGKPWSVQTECEQNGCSKGLPSSAIIRPAPSSARIDGGRLLYCSCASFSICRSAKHEPSKHIEQRLTVSCLSTKVYRVAVGV